MVKIANGFNSSDLISWLTFGKYIINVKQLKEQSVLNFRYATYSNIQWLKRQKIDKFFQTFWIDLINTKQINYDLLRECSDKDIELFEKILLKCCLHKDLDYHPVQSYHSQCIERFNILRGEIMSGNTNEDLIRQLNDVIDKLIIYGKLKQEEKGEIINDMKEYINENKI